MEPCIADPYVFVCQLSGKNVVFIVVYVDELQVGCESNSQSTEIKFALSKQFKIKYLVDVRFVLIIIINYNWERELLHIFQS